MNGDGRARTLSDDSGAAPTQQTQQAASPGRRPLPAGLVFDDPLDRRTADDTDIGWGESPAASRGRDLEWYLSQKPPHHG
jgi:hypothetical protein